MRHAGHTNVTTAPLGNKGAPQTGAQGGQHRYMIAEPPQPRRFKVRNSRGAHREPNARGLCAEARSFSETTIRFYRVCTACCHHAGQGPGLLSGGLAGGPNKYTPALHRIGEGPQCTEPRQNLWRGDDTARTSICSSPIPRALGMKSLPSSCQGKRCVDRLRICMTCTMALTQSIG